jgi:hypothetical protein
VGVPGATWWSGRASELGGRCGAARGGGKHIQATQHNQATTQGLFVDRAIVEVVGRLETLVGREPLLLAYLKRLGESLGR